MFAAKIWRYSFEDFKSYTIHPPATEVWILSKTQQIISLSLHGCKQGEKQHDKTTGYMLHEELFLQHTANVCALNHFWCEVAYVHKSGGIPNHVPQTEMTSQPDKVSCQSARPRLRYVGGIMDWRQSQDRAAAGLLSVSARQLAAVMAPTELRASEAERDGSRCETQAITEPCGLLFHG